MNMSILIKSGTGGHYDYDGCDLLIKKIDIKDFPIPRIGETIRVPKKIAVEGKVSIEKHSYLVKDVCYWIVGDSYGVDIYVIPVEW